MFQGVAEFHGISLRTDPLPPVAVAGNRHHLRQVLNNLLDNAIKFTAVKFPERTNSNGRMSGPTPQITVSLTCDESRRQACLTVTDNGIGIGLEHLPHIFDRFYREVQGRTREGAASGTGLGLSICRAIVEAHHGKIRAESVPGEGTTFKVMLPLKGTAHDTSAGRTDAATAAAS
jgi:signal transduction histidine kinase